MSTKRSKSPKSSKTPKSTKSTGSTRSAKGAGSTKSTRSPKSTGSVKGTGSAKSTRSAKGTGSAKSTGSTKSTKSRKSSGKGAEAPKQDEVYREPKEHIVDFAFNEEVSIVFADMIRRSVPGYETVIPISGLIAARHIPDGGRCYDLGCSLGASALAVLRSLGGRPCEVVAIDSSDAMIAEACVHAPADARLSWITADIRDAELQPCDAVLMNYVLQFLPPEDRLEMLKSVRAVLRPSGVLVLSEKLMSDALFEAIHLDYKRANGYSELEISQKRTALENVMRIDALETHHDRLREAGFSRVQAWFQCLNWCSIVALP